MNISPCYMAVDFLLSTLFTAVVVSWWAGTHMLASGMFNEGHKCEPGKQNVY